MQFALNFFIQFSLNSLCRTVVINLHEVVFEGSYMPLLLHLECKVKGPV